MTFEQWKELIPIVFGQLTILLVALIHAWASAQGRRENRETQARIESRLVELNERTEKLKERSNGEQ